jgi:ubiquinone/menaquinone biosynthesis C-methylase UbiE
MYLEQIKTTTELHDLGDVKPELSGILSPVYSEDFVGKFIHEQFLEDARTYIQLYQNCGYWKWLLQNSQPYLEIDPSRPLNILDIGSGAGNTVFPLLEIYPNANVIASDLSIPLLKALKEYSQEHYGDKNLLVMQLNAEELVFEPGEIDLVIGGAILHHLFDPSKTIKEAYKALKPGGYALFYEPFEAGNQMLSLIFKELIEKNQRRSSDRQGGLKAKAKSFLKKQTLPPEESKIPDKVVQLFKLQMEDFEIRKNPDKTQPIFQRLDDKWLFTKSYFEKAAKSAGFREITIYPIHDTQGAFGNQIRTILSIGLGLDESALPQWAWDCANRMDNHFSDQLKEDLLLEGCIILRK